jgi:hypothetical protein
MAADVRVDINYAAVRGILRSREVQQDLFRRASRIRDVCGEDYAADSAVGSSRARATVWTDTPEAMSIEARGHVLLRALDAGRG